MEQTMGSTFSYSRTGIEVPLFPQYQTEDRPINSKGFYDFNQPNAFKGEQFLDFEENKEEEEYPADFEDYIATVDNEELQKVVNLYAN